MTELQSAVERAIAAEAAAHAEAVLALNPYSEADFLELGCALAVYSGVASPWNALYGDLFSLEPRDWDHVKKFFSERDAHCLAWGTEKFPVPAKKMETMLVYAETLSPMTNKVPPAENIPPETWPLLFTQERRPESLAPDFLAALKFQQRETRFYAQNKAASYTFFHGGVAWVPFPAEHSLLELQKRDAGNFGCRFFATTAPGFSPFAFERTLYEF